MMIENKDGFDVKPVFMNADNFVDDSSLRVNEEKNLKFIDIKYFVLRGRGTNNKFILKGISGEFKCGQLSAIMGPSGAGKSSLMNILTGYCMKNMIGDVYVGKKLRNVQKFRKMSCYIMQDDVLLPHLSIQEAMMCSANLKLSEATSNAVKKQIVDNIINVMGLREAAHTVTSKLSGGQKKRLAIAQELVNNPPIMFFDEPTSGLDSASCFQCISLLHRLARGGRTIICTIHQPSAKIFELFDHLYFLADGHCIYRGSISCLVPYLATKGLICPSYHNPADYFMEVACGEHGDNVMRLALAVRDAQADTQCDYCTCKQKMNAIDSSSNSETSKAQSINTESCVYCRVMWSNSSRANFSGDDSKSGCTSEHKKQPVITPEIEFCSFLPKTNGRNETLSNTITFKDDEMNGSLRQERAFAANQMTQIRVLFVRSVFSILRDSTLTHLRLLSHVVVGLLIGLLYFRIGQLGNEVISNAAFIFFSLLFIMFASLMPTVMTFPMEISIFFREHLNYWYSLKCYYFARSLADVPFQILFPILYSSITYWMTEQPAEFMRYFLFIVVTVQTALVGQSLGLVIGAATSIEVAIFLGPVTGIPIMLFSGFFLNFDAIPKYLQWLSYISYTRFSFSAAMKVIYGFNRTDLDCTRKRPSRVSFPCVLKPTIVLDAMNINDYSVYLDFTILFVFFILLRMLGYYILRWRVKVQR